MILDKKLLFTTLILFLVFLLSIFKKGNFLICSTLLILLTLFSYNLIFNKKMTKQNKLYTGGILLLFFIWLFGVIFNCLNNNSKIEGFNNELNKQKTLTAKDYEELFFVLKTLVNFNYQEIRTVIIGNDLNSVFDLSKRIRKENKPEKLFRLNVRFETVDDGSVVLTESNSEKSNIEIENYITNPKMIAFADLIQIPGFSLDLIVKLINVYKIPKLTVKSYPLIIESLNIENENRPVETLGLNYFVNKETIEDSYFEFFMYLLGDHSYVKGKTLEELKISLNPTLQNSTFSFMEKIQIIE